MKYITFTVPCYNSENYMRRCIDSLLTGGSDVEIILINDGSTDGTARIADEYQLTYPDIVRAVHKENGGHGSGVNKGSTIKWWILTTGWIRMHIRNCLQE